MEKTVLLIVDAQVNMFEPEPVYQAESVLENIAALIARARSAGVPVVFTKNNGPAGSPDEPGSPGWEIHPRLKPGPGEVVIEKDTPNAFAGTTLGEVLGRDGCRSLVLAGMQTESCIAATVRQAAGLGYDVILASDAHSTYDSGEQTAGQLIERYNQSLSELVQVIPADEIDF